MANGTTTTEDLAKEIADKFVAQLDPDKLTSAISKGVVDGLFKKTASQPIQQKSTPKEDNQPKTTTEPKPVAPSSEATKSIETSLEKNFKMLGNILNPMSNLLNLLIDKSATTSKENKFPDLFRIPLQKLIKQMEPMAKNLADLKKDTAEHDEDITSSVNKKTEAAAGTIKTAPPAESLLEKVDKPQRIEFTREGIRQLLEILPDVIKKGSKGLITGLRKDRKPAPAGGINMLGGLGLLAGLASLVLLVYGLQTESPFKGLAKLGSRLTATVFTKLCGNLFKPFLSFFNLFEKFAKTPLGGLIRKIFGPIKEKFAGVIERVVGGLKGQVGSIFESIGTRITVLGKGLLRSVGGMIKGAFGKGASQVFGKGVGKLVGFLPEFLMGALKAIKVIPFIGALVSIGFAVSRFRSGDRVGGGLDLLSGIAGVFGLWPVSLAIDALNAFLDFKAGGIGKEAKQGKGAMIASWIGSAGKWLGGKLYDMPIIGNMIKAVESFGKREWMEGVKQLAMSTPVGHFVSMVTDWLSTDQGSKQAQGAVGGAVDWIGSAGKWLGKKLYNMPMIGNLIKAVESFGKREWMEGLKQLALSTPIGAAVGAVLDMFGGANAVGTAVGGAVGGAMDWIGSAGKWIGDKIYNMPLVRSLIKSREAFGKGNWTEGFKLLAMATPFGPIISSLFDMLEASAPQTEGEKAAGAPPVSIFTKFKEMITEKIKSLWKSLSGWVKRAASWVLPEELIKSLNGGVDAKPETKESSTPPVVKEGAPVPQTGDAAIGPDGGLIVSSPKEGAIVQLSKKDGIIAGPLSGASSSSDKILSKIADNSDTMNANIANLVVGFNTLAKALQGLGVSIGGMQPSNTNVIAGGKSQASPAPSKSSDFSRVGNPAISNYRILAESARQVPA